MEILSKDELWRCFLHKEPTRTERKRRYLYHGFLFYLLMCRKYPVQCLVEILACALIFGLMFGMLYLSEIAGWLEKVMR
jgi:hypothetical protein